MQDCVYLYTFHIIRKNILLYFFFLLALRLCSTSTCHYCDYMQLCPETQSRSKGKPFSVHHNLKISETHLPDSRRIRSCCSECELGTLTIAVALMKNDECSEHTCFMGATITKWLHMGKYFMYMILLSSPANEWNTGPRYYCSHICK